MNTNENKKYIAHFEDGVYAVPSDVKVKIRALYEYCKENNVNPDQLTEEQMAKFIEKRES